MEEEKKFPVTTEMIINALVEGACGSIPVVGSFLSAAFSLKGDVEQNQKNAILQAMIISMQEEVSGITQTITELNRSLDVTNEKISKRINSKSFQRLFKQTIKNWSSVDSEEKRLKVRNILANAALWEAEDDDRVRDYLSWTMEFSDTKAKIFAIIREVGNAGITRAKIWERMGYDEVPREVSRKTDYFKRILHELENDQLIRVKKDLEENGNLIKKDYEQGDIYTNRSFDDEVLFRVTNLGSEYADYISETTPEC